MPVLVGMLCILAACKDRTGSAAGFVIEGTIEGLPDSTTLLLKYSLPGTPPDSTIVHNGRFEFRGYVNDTTRAIQAIVCTRDMEQYKFLWLENTHIKFTGTADNLRAARVTGPATQADANALQASVSPITKEADSLRTIWYRMPGAAEREASGLEDRIRILDEEQQKREITFVRQYPASLVSAYVLSIYSSTWGRKLAGDLYAQLSDANKRSAYGKSVQTFLDINKDLDIGDKSIDIDLPNANGQRIRLSDVKGKYILLEFWASWCGPCRRENPQLVQTYKQYQSTGFAIYGVSLDSERDKWIGAIETDKLPWINVCDLTGDESTPVMAYGISSIPDNFLIDSTGTIVGRNLRGETLRGRLAGLMPGAKP